MMRASQKTEEPAGSGLTEEIWDNLIVKNIMMVSDSNMLNKLRMNEDILTSK